MPVPRLSHRFCVYVKPNSVELGRKTAAEVLWFCGIPWTENVATYLNNNRTKVNTQDIKKNKTSRVIWLLKKPNRPVWAARQSVSQRATAAYGRASGKLIPDLHCE